jgi:hypothetical protein
VRPDAFAAVMATGIVSFAAADHGFQRISLVLAVIAVVLFAALVIAALFWLRPDLMDVEVPLQLLTFVAACAVVGTRLDWLPLGLVGLLGWLVLLPIALRAMYRHRWTWRRDRARGGWELAGVSTSGLAIVVADLGFAAARRQLVGDGVPAGDVLVGHVRDSGRNGLAVADHDLAGVLLDRAGRVAAHLLRSAAAISPITRCGCSVRSNHVNRNTCQPFSEMWFCRVRSR